MKKVLALVLAVIMVCTMAMAAVTTANGTAVKPSSSNSDKVLQFDLTGKVDKNGTFYVQIKDEVFTTLEKAYTRESTASLTINKDNYTVTAEVSGVKTSVVFADGHCYLAFSNMDKLLDAKADATISTVKVKLNVKGNTYVEFTVDDGVLVESTTVIAGNTAYKLNSTELTNSIMDGVKVFGAEDYAAWDFGYAGTELETGDSITVDGWYYVGEDAKATDVIVEDVLGEEVALIDLAKNATLKATYVDADDYADAIDAAQDAVNAAAKKAKVNAYFDVLGGVALTTKVDFVIDKGDDVYVYTLNENGTVSASPFKFADGEGWTLSAKEMPMTVVSNVELTTVAAPTDGTTTNPGTGANDVVGVAAALAVVALVSGAAISLKK